MGCWPTIEPVDYLLATIGYHWLPLAKEVGDKLYKTMPGPEWSIGNRANAHLCICKAYGIQRTKVTEVSRDSPIQTKQYKTQFQIGESQINKLFAIYLHISTLHIHGDVPMVPQRNRNPGVDIHLGLDSGPKTTMLRFDQEIQESFFASLPQPVVWPEKAWLATSLVLFSKENCAIWCKHMQYGFIAKWSQNGCSMEKNDKPLDFRDPIFATLHRAVYRYP